MSKKQSKQEKRKQQLKARQIGYIGGLILVVTIVVFAMIKMYPSDTHTTNTENTGNSYYDNTITQSELESKLKNGDEVTVYFFHPKCSACQETAPIVFPMSEELGFKLYSYDITKQPFEKYGITATPTIIHFENGIEVNRTVGNVGKEMFNDFFNRVVLK